MGPELEFFDCNVYLGLPMNRPGGWFGPPPATAQALLAEMDRAGVARALVWHAAQYDGHPATGNRLLSEAIAGCDRLAGCWSILPPQTGELGDVGEFLAAAVRSGVRAFRAFPDMHRYLLRRDAMGGLLERLAEARAPLLVRAADKAQWESLYDLLRELPELTVIATDMGNWGSDRYFRPLVERRQNFYIETSGYMTDGGMEAFVESYGAGRLLFGSGFPQAYLGAFTLTIAHCDIAPPDKAAIAGGNLARLLAEVKL